MQSLRNGLAEGGAADPRDLSISMEKANLMAGAVVLPLSLVVGGGAYLAIQGWPGGPEIDGMGGLLVLVAGILAVFVGSVVVHEALHAVGMLLIARAPRGAIHFGVDRATLTPYAGCRTPMTARAYRGVVGLPGLVLGVIPWVAALVTGSGYLLAFALWMLAAAGGDALVLWVIRSLPGDARVMDHPSRCGCVVVD